MVAEVKKQKSTVFHGDRPIESAAEDRLGFGGLAANIATSLVAPPLAGGMVVGIEGKWGSGKSSLVKLIEEELRGKAENPPHSVLHFQPWLIGNRDALIGGLFAELAAKLDGIKGDESRKTAEKLRGFMRGVGAFGGYVRVVGGVLEYVPGTPGKAVRGIGGRMEKLGLRAGKEPEVPLATQKAKLEEALRELGHRFIVIIDDVDRLEPAELVEVLRLVRAVADLPNIVYLLCYDAEIVAHNIQQAIGVASGKAYLEKIVQLVVPVPQPEAFQLRQWFAAELGNFATTRNGDESARLSDTITHEGSAQLHTPRDVNRVLDALRFMWPPLEERSIDLADLVWVQLIKVGNDALYRWLETYCAGVAAIRCGVAQATDDGVEQTYKEWVTATPETIRSNSEYIRCFTLRLPMGGFNGILLQEKQHKNNNKLIDLYIRNDSNEMRQHIKAKRIGSPDHYRLYFSLDTPSHSLDFAEYQAVWHAAAQCPEEAGKAILRLHENDVLPGLTKAQHLLGPGWGDADALLSNEQRRNLLLAFAGIMDEAERQRPQASMTVNSLWQRVHDRAVTLSSRLDDATRTGTFEEMFGSGKALCWLVDLYRREIRKHGRFDGNRTLSQQWILNSDNELDAAARLLLARFRAMEASQFFRSFGLINLLKGWKECGDDAGPRDLLASAIETDEGLVSTFEQILEGMRHPFSSRRDSDIFSIAEFLDFDVTVTRLRALQCNLEFASRVNEFRFLSSLREEADPA